MHLRTLVGIGTVALAAVAGLGATGNPASLLEAVKQGNREAIRSLVTRRAEVVAREADGTTPLHWAVRAADRETVALLIGAGADVSAANRYGITPLWLAAVNDDATIVETLLKAGADPNATLPSGETALLVASRTGNVGAVKVLIAHSADVRVTEGVFGQTALMVAAAENHPEVCRVLIAAGADVTARSTLFEPKTYVLTNTFKGGFTALLYAARQGALDAARALVESGADLNEIEPDGTAPLMIALVNGHYDLAALLVEKGADVNLADAAGRTPLYQAVDMHRLEFMAGRPTPKWSDKLDSLDLVKILLERGADPNVPLKKAQPTRKGGSPDDPWLAEGTTVFLKAAKNNDLPIMRLLLQHAADPYAQSRRAQATALMFAAGMGWRELASIAPEKDGLEAVKLLWELGGFDIDAVDINGQTALHGAAGRGAPSIIQFLVDRGAKLDIVDKKGRTPLIESGPVEEGMTAGTHPMRPAAHALLRQLMGLAPDSASTASLAPIVR